MKKLTIQLIEGLENLTPTRLNVIDVEKRVMLREIVRLMLITSRVKSVIRKVILNKTVKEKLNVLIVEKLDISKEIAESKETIITKDKIMTKGKIKEIIIKNKIMLLLLMSQKKKFFN